ncbi:hypothetical protein BH09ACT12_BH09ACT12_04720 [soil metagenome]
MRRVASVAVAIVLVAAVVAVLLVTLGGSDDDSPPAPPAGSGDTTAAPPLSTPLADVDTSTLTVQRAGFCDLLAPESIEAVLGGAPKDVRTYGNGESTVITSDITDIAHEYGCRWKRGSTAARAWVFAPPVTPDDATRLVTAARRSDGCDVRRGAAAFGSPSVARTCPVGKGFEASYRGLFGDAWLACSFTAPGDDRRKALDLAGAWCAAVAQAAAQPPA